MKLNYTLKYAIMLALTLGVFEFASAQVGINTSNPNTQLHIKNQSNVSNGITIENNNFSGQLLAESVSTQNSLFLNNSSTNGQIDFGFANTKLITLNRSQFFPIVNAVSNTVTTSGAVDLGVFSNHFRRVYTRGVHTNDNSVNGGLGINIGSGGGTANDYTFSDFAFYPVVNDSKTLGRNGNFWSAAYSVNYFVPSDEKLKNNIKSLTSGLDIINKIKTYSYAYNSDRENRIHFGFMAQELQKVLPNIVNEADTEDKTLAVNYTELIPVLVNAIKEQTEQIEKLRKEVASLKAQVIKQ